MPAAQAWPAVSCKLLTPMPWLRWVRASPGLRRRGWRRAVVWPPRRWSHCTFYVSCRANSPQAASRMPRWRPALAAAFLPGCAAVPRARADMFLMRRSASATTAWRSARSAVSLCRRSLRWGTILRCSAPGRETAFLRLALPLTPLTLRATDRWQGPQARGLRRRRLCCAAGACAAPPAPPVEQRAHPRTWPQRRPGQGRCPGWAQHRAPERSGCARPGSRRTSVRAEQSPPARGSPCEQRLRLAG